MSLHPADSLYSLGHFLLPIRQVIRYTNERIVLYDRVTAVTPFRCNFSLRQNETRQHSTFTQLVWRQVAALQYAGRCTAVTLTRHTFGSRNLQKM
jgi:hypothetical protein